MGFMDKQAVKAARSPHASAETQGAVQVRLLEELVQLERESLQVQREILAELRAGQTARQ